MHGGDLAGGHAPGAGSNGGGGHDRGARSNGGHNGGARPNGGLGHDHGPGHDGGSPDGDGLADELAAFLSRYSGELTAFRRDLHAHPELGYHEHRTTRRVAARLASAGLRPVGLPKGTGLIVDIGPGSAAAGGVSQAAGARPGSGGRSAAGGSAAGAESGDGLEGPVVALRADLDALPVPDEKNVPYRSTVPNLCHACGHDVHTTVLLGAGLFLNELAARGALPGRVRLVFQPAEEVPGGALDVLAAGGIASVDRIFALHCDPRLDAGTVGVRTGAITAACDKVMVRVTGPGGHTARPHLTADLVYALGKIVTELPAALSRRVDPRSSLSLVWGRVNAGTAPNAIPDEGIAEGTVRCLDDKAWHAAPDLIKALVDSVASGYGVSAELSYERSVPPTVNEASSVRIVTEATEQVLGAGAIVPAPQSLGGEDFAWFLESIPGALARLGTRGPGLPGGLDIHRGTFDVDERAIGLGVKVMAATALAALYEETGEDSEGAAGAAAAAGAAGGQRTAPQPVPGAAVV